MPVLLTNRAKKGNAAFLKGQLALALASYTTAIQLDPSVAAYPLNRAAVYLKQSEWVRAEKDATTALELDGGNNVKALYRRATARRHTGKLELAQQGELPARSFVYSKLVRVQWADPLVLRWHVKLDDGTEQISNRRRVREEAQTSTRNSR